MIYLRLRKREKIVNRRKRYILHVLDKLLFGRFKFNRGNFTQPFVLVVSI